jgi:hypothetical protein
MPETQPIHLRLAADEIDALRRAARMEGRPLASMGRAAIVRWLRDQKLLPPLEEGKANDE